MFGIIFGTICLIGLIVVRANWQAWLAFGVVATLALLWPLRIWLLTGNPFYSLPLGSHLPVNERFLAWINNDAAALGGVLCCGWVVGVRDGIRPRTRGLVGHAASSISLIDW